VSGELRYVDAGHGYAFMIHGDRSIVQLNAGNGPILGVEEGFEFEAQVVPVPSCGTVLVMSDGIVEQPAQLLARDTSTARRPFDIEGVTRAIANADTDDLVAALFDSVIAHAGTSQLSDDATIVSATWNRAHQAAI
jgi:serine phosphatase RsbU (regulator of sigma subunit)